MKPPAGLAALAGKLWLRAGVSLVGVGLMTLMFWSHRHRRDELAHYPDPDRPAPDRAWASDE